MFPGTITYTPPANFIGNDIFWYSISDGQSAAAFGIVTVTDGAGSAVWLQAISGPKIDHGDFVARLVGMPGLTYTIEAASSLAGPWVKIENFTAPTTDQGFGIGGFEVRETIGSNTNRFYRTVYPAY